jgi:outer membrane protein assembly factor BamB
MFGRSVKEFSSSPLVVAGERVLAQTELGTLASLDLFSGRIQWQTTYRQIPLPKTRSYQPPSRQLTWTRLAPPVVVGDVVVAAPSDSMEVLAVRLTTGAQLWAYTEDSLQGLDRESEMQGFNHLLGADTDTLYLSGSKLSALHKAGGIGTNAPFNPRWTQPLDRTDTAPRALLAGDAVIAANEKLRVVHDRRTGAVMPTLTGGWGGGEAGALCLEDGALFSLSAQGLSGYFDWQGQLERARRLADASAEAGPLRTAAELYLRHGTLQLEGGDAGGARTTLEEARVLFTRLRAKGGRADARDELACLRALAESLARLQRADEALILLAEARALAAGAKELSEVLFLEERVLRARGGPERIARLDEIEACWGEQPLPGDVRAESIRRWLADVSTSGASEPVSDSLPTVLWVALERAHEHELAGALAPALEDLHVALRHARGLALARGLPLANLVNERIAHLLARPGAEQAYAAIEARATELLASGGDNEAALEALNERYPHSRAAEQALGLLIERAALAHDAPAVARLVRTALARGGLSAERESALLLVLAQTLGQRGNAAFERSLVTALARSSPIQVSPAHGGRTLADLAAEFAKETLEALPAPVLFDPGVVSGGKPRALDATFVGTLSPAGQAPESAPYELHLYATRSELEAYSSAAPSKPLWTRALDLGSPPCAFAPGLVVLGTRTGLLCLDERGEELWSHASEDDPPIELAHSGGVLLALLRSERVLALDALLGLLLWERTLEADDNWTGPVAGDGHVVFFSQLHKLPPRALVLDLFRGRVTADVRLSGYDSKPPLARSAWIEEQRLIAPAFGLRPGQLSAFELQGGQRAWTIEFGRDEELHAVAHAQGRAYPITLATALGPAAGNGGVYELDARTGTVRKVVPLKPGERIMGFGAQLSVELPAPYLFTYAHSEKEHSVPIRALHLPYGVKWTWALPIGPQETYDGRTMPMPAVSADCVAIAYQVRRTGGVPGSESTVVLVDKHAGKKVDTLVLGPAFASSNRLELRGLGAALFVLGKGSTPRGACLDILEKLR